MKTKVQSISPKLVDTNPDLELSILSLFYKDKKFLLKFYQYVKPEYFSSQTFSFLFSLVTDFYSQFSRLPTHDETKAEVIKFYFDDSQKDVLDKVLTVVEALYVFVCSEDYVNKNVLAFIKQAEVYNILVKANNDWEQVDISDVYDKIKYLANLQLDNEDLGVSSQDFLSHLLNRDDEDFGLPTGFPLFDQVIRGGFREGELSIILAPTNRGKTAVLINIGRGLVAAGHRVVHFSLEMNYESMVDRYIASMTGLKINDLDSINMKQLAGILHNYTVYTKKDVIIKYYSPNSITVADLEVYLEKLEQESDCKADAIIIDYADLLRASNVRKEKRHELSEIHVELKQLGDKFNVPIITASQTNRQGELLGYAEQGKQTLRNLKPLSVAHIAEDWSKAGIADYIFGLRSPVPYSQLNDDEHLLIMDVLKSRFSKRGEKILFKINFGKCHMEDLNPANIDFQALQDELSDATKDLEFDAL